MENIRLKMGSGPFGKKSDLVNWALWPLGGTYEYNFIKMIC